MSTENTFAWFTAWVNQNLGLCVTFAKNRSWDQMLEGFDLSTRLITTESFEQAAYGASMEKLRAGVVGDWGYTVEHLTALGCGDEVLSRLSANDGEAVCLAYTSTINTFMYAKDGSTLSGFDMTVPHIRYGPRPERFDAEMESAGFNTDGVPDPGAMGARLLQIAFDITLTREVLEQPLPSVELENPWG